MKALSIKQPWAWLIVNGFKDTENRTWRTDFRGRIYIHAGSRFAARDYYDIRAELSISSIKALYPNLCLPHPDDLVVGAIVGEATLVGCRDNSISIWAEEGLWHWHLVTPVAYEKPIKYKGQLGLFEVDLGLRRGNL